MALPFAITIVGTVASLILLYEYAEAPQQAFLEKRGWPEGLCVFLGYLLIPVEAAMINLVVFALLFGKVTSTIQESVLRAHGVEVKLMQLYGVDTLSDGSMLTGLINNLIFLVLQLTLLVATLQFHAIPGLGQVLWVACSGWVRPWELVAELLPLIGYRHCGSQVSHVIWHMFSYVTFGFVAFTLELCPFVNLFFIAGNAYGSALLFEGFVDEGKVGPDYLRVSSSNNNNQMPLNRNQTSKLSDNSVSSKKSKAGNSVFSAAFKSFA